MNLTKTQDNSPKKEKRTTSELKDLDFTPLFLECLSDDAAPDKLSIAFKSLGR